MFSYSCCACGELLDESSVNAAGLKVGGLKILGVTVLARGGSQTVYLPLVIA